MFLIQMELEMQRLLLAVVVTGTQNLPAVVEPSLASLSLLQDIKNSNVSLLEKPAMNQNERLPSQP
jgi:hypothetical protein